MDAQGGQPVGLDYTQETWTTDSRGNVASVHLKLPAGTSLPTHVRGYVLADVFPLANGVLS